MTLMSRLGVVRGNSKWRCSLDHDMTFYWSAIVSIALSCTISSYLTLNNIVTLQCKLRGTQDK